MRRLLLLVWLFCCLPMAGWGQTLHLTQIKQDARTKTVSLYFSAEKPVKTHSFSLTHPDRFIIDIQGAQAFANQLSPALWSQTPITKIRSSIMNPHTLRIVLDLKAQKHNRWQIIFNNVPAHPLATAKQTVLIRQPISFPSAKRSKEIMVVIDPGHGGKDPGAIGNHSLKEKDVVLAIAKKLQGLINKQPGFKAVLTRDGDYFLSLRERLNIARENKADMFIAIHADAVDDPIAHGVSVYALSLRGATSEAARWEAARENQSALIGGVQLADKGDVLRSVLINLSQSATIQTSLTIGHNLLENIKTFADLHYQRMEQAAFVVLKSPDIPSLLVETGFLSNSIEEKKLNYANYQLNLAQAMMRGIKEYFTARPPPGTWLAANTTNKKNTIIPSTLRGEG